MADPFTIIGTTAAIIDLTICAAKVIKIARDAYKSGSTTPENENLKAVMDNFVQLMDKLDAQESLGSGMGTAELITRCRNLAEKIFCLIEKMQPKQSNSVVSSLRAAITTISLNTDVEQLKTELDICMNMLNSHIQNIMR